MEVSRCTEDSEASKSVPASTEKVNAKRLRCKQKADSDFDYVLTEFMRESDERHAVMENKLFGKLIDKL